jgi:RNA recognition motif-containing protein
MESKLYIGNMSYETTEQDLRTMFSEAGTVGSVELIMDRQTGKPKGFGFLTMSSQAEAEKAISLFDTKEVNTRSLKVNFAKPREERPAMGSRPASH